MYPQPAHQSTVSGLQEASLYEDTSSAEPPAASIASNVFNGAQLANAFFRQFPAGANVQQLADAEYILQVVRQEFGLFTDDERNGVRELVSHLARAVQYVADYAGVGGEGYYWHYIHIKYADLTA